ncbi:MAG: glycosyltransferase family 39 protein [Lachnospiraceae bacterium]|nr:glycosyltransferase family 39 protein [Lachnospiraceae bacterium]
MTGRKIIVNLIFSVSVIALSLIWNFSIYELFTNAYVVTLFGVIINLFIFTPLLIIIFAKFDFIEICRQNWSLYKLIPCGLIAVVLCIRMAQQSYVRIYYDIISGYHEPQIIKNFFEITSFSARTTCIVIGAAAIFALVMILLTLLEFAIYLLKKPHFNLLDESDFDPKQIILYRRMGFSLLAFMTIIMFAFANAQSFWFDEMVWTIGKVANKSFAEIAVVLLEDGYNMPLYYYALAIIYPLMPYGEIYILSISIISVVFGIGFLYFAANKIGGKLLAYITVCISALSSVLLTRGAWELRPYPFLFCFSALTVWIYYKRIKEENFTNIILYGIVMTLLIYTHWYGAVLLVFYGFGDLILCIMKKVKLRCIISYLIALGAVLPWFIFMLMMVKNDLSVVTVSLVPKWISIINSIDIILNSNSLLFLLFAIAAIITCVIAIRFIKVKEWNTASYLWIHTLLSIFWIIMVTFIYSRYLNPKGSIYTERYFFILVPHAILLISFAIKSLDEIFKSKRNFIYISAFLALMGIIGYSKAISSVTQIHQPYREVAELISAEEKAYLENTLILTSAGDEAWLDYYFRKRGFAVPQNIAFGLTMIRVDGVPSEIVVDYDDLYEFDKILVWYNYFPIPEQFTVTWKDEKTMLTLYEK